MAGHLDTHELLSPGLMVKYHKDGKPTADVKTRLRNAASVARTVMRKTVWEIDKVVLFHRSESDTFAAIMDKHFCLHSQADLRSTKDAKGKRTNEKARRTYLAKVRKIMLSVSFHLNTGMYLLDVDAGFRQNVGDSLVQDMHTMWGEDATAGDGSTVRVVSKNIEGYVAYKQKSILGKQFTSSGPIHLSFLLAAAPHDYTAAQLARVIIHEATHTYCRTIDVKYCWDADYDSQSAAQMQNNADSYAFAAMSLKAGKTLNATTLPAEPADSFK